jgi:alpha-mannosidase
VQGSFYIKINPPEEAAQWRRIKGQQLLMPLQLAFSVLEVYCNLAAYSSP